MNIQMEETHRAGYMGRGRELRCLLWVHLFPNTRTCSPAWKLSEHCTFGIFTEVSSHRRERSLTPFFSPSSSQEKGQGRAENFRLLIMAWSFRWPAFIQELTQSHLIKTKDTSITQGIMKVSGDLCQELGAKTKYIFLLPRRMTLSQQLTTTAPFQNFEKSEMALKSSLIEF